MGPISALATDTQKLFNFFDDITKIPRESKREEKIIKYLIDFAKSRKLEYKVDTVGNVLITKVASKGMESLPTVILQSHSDMVCEKNSDITHDFEKDPIEYIEENGWLIAKETTLGADCGIGIAAQLAILDSKTIEHGRIEALFTTDEETGMTGAENIAPDFLSGKILLNLDSEDEGELFIGCAGGIDTTAKYKFSKNRSPKNKLFVKFGFYGATGGHSGDDIEKNRANANQLLLRFLYQAINRWNIHLCHIDGGNKRNAIAREAYVILAIDPSDKTEISTLFSEIERDVKSEYCISDPNLFGKIEDSERFEEYIDDSLFLNIVRSLHACPHGVLAMSQDIPGFVETSTNLASIKIEEESSSIRIGTSQRSSSASSRRNAADRVEAALLLGGATVTHESEYPGWKPKLDSMILEISKAAYIRLFKVEPIVRAIHAGLECGLLLDKYPHLDLISFGPTVRGAHAPGEKLDIESTEKFWRLLVEILKNIK